MTVRVAPGSLLILLARGAPRFDVRVLLLMACAAGLGLGGCGDGDPSGLQLGRDAEAVSTPDEPSDEEPSTDEDSGEPPAKPTPVELPPDEADAGESASADDGAVSADASAGDAESVSFDAATDLDASDADLADAAGLDGALAEDSGTDAGLAPDASTCPDGGQRDACGVCGGEATSCHPLFGRYAARTQLYARQRSQITDGTNFTPIDVVSKGVLLSVVDIDAQGRAKEHYCVLELAGTLVVEGTEAPIASWLKPSASQHIPDTTIPLTLAGGRYTRARDAHKTYYGWLPDGCSTSTGLPANASDCRVRDTDQDAVKGGAMFLGLAKPDDPETGSADLQLNIAAQLSFGWSLPASAAPKLLGSLSGGFQLVELSRSGSLSTFIGQVQNTACPDDVGHIELVRNDATTCAAIVAGRVADPKSAGMFDVSLDAPLPQPSACVEPACAQDTDSDGTPNCNDGCPSDPAKIAAGACGCGTPETNSDGDSAPNCVDGCPQDRAKTAAGICGCGVADTNTDGDALVDCKDGCPSDAAKTAAGSCGCGIADTNRDGDALPDCKDGCPANAAKTAPGVCGCAVADTDSDHDGLPNCNDACPDDPAKTTLGLCGCGVAETNSDGDSQPDCTDACDNDASKVAAGACGCGTPDTNTDGDSQPDCKDQCPRDAAKTVPGACGCGTADTNTDGDSLPNCTDGCPNDANKTAAGVCGCGVAETNSDHDSQPDCQEQCDADPNKLQPGVCGCGVADKDLNNDGTIDCSDSCPNDPAKVAPGLCGCGVADTNTDGDSLPNCTDGCPSDASKTAAGQCGCGVADTDSDGDHVANCNDACPNDPAKTGSSVCGCGVADTDSDGDGRPNCTDGCPNDAGKVAAGVCGCGVADTNTDGDSLPNCTDGCPNDANKTAAGVCGCGVADTDSDGDHVANCKDACPNDASKTAAGLCGCGVAETNSDGDSLPDCTDQCDNNPNLTVPGACGCDACPPNPLIGTFAVRAAVFGKQRNGTEVVSSKSLNYSLVTVSQNSDGTLRLSEQGCWTQSLPNPNVTGTKAYSWSKPAWVQAIAPSVQNLVANSNGSYTRSIATRHFGWDPARQPASCSTSSTPVSPWPSGWGSTCRCTAPASSLPPYDTNTSPYDCRLVDVDGDGQPGLSANAGTAAPSSPDANAPTLGGTAFAAVDGSGTWLITPQSNGKHTATINDTSVAQLVGCTGLACSQLSSTPAGSVSCPQSLNRAQFVPTTASSDSCSEIISARDTLFVQDQDSAWPDATACPPPP